MSKRKIIYWGYPLFVIIFGPLVVLLIEIGVFLTGYGSTHALEQSAYFASIFWPLYGLLLLENFAGWLFFLVPIVLTAFYWWFRKPSRKSGIALMIACNVILGLPGYLLTLNIIFF